MKAIGFILRLTAVFGIFAVFAVQSPAQPSDPFGGAPGARSAAAQRGSEAANRSGVDNPFHSVGEPQPTPASPPQAARRESAATDGQVEIPEDQLCKCLGETSGAAERIRKVVEGPLKSRGMEYADAALEQVTAELSAEYGIPIQIDASALDDHGLSPDEPVTINLHGVSLRAALNHLLSSHQLTYVIQDEVLLVTTVPAAEQDLRICLYDVRNLVADPQDAGGIASLIDVISSCVAPDTWAESGGGTAELRAMDPGLLVISQTFAVHQEIKELLSVIQQMRSRPAGASASINPRRDQLVTRHYLLNVAKPDNQDAFGRQLYSLIVAQSPEHTWGVPRDDSQATLLAILPDRVIVRHTEAVQRQVESLLVDMGLTTRSRAAASSATGRPSGRGGSGFFQSSPERASAR